MKVLVFISLCLLSVTSLKAQQTFNLPQVSSEQEKEILYNHVVAYLATGITFAATNGVSAKDYGKYIGEQFKPFWNPEAGFEVFANQLMFIMKGVNSFSELEIVEQSEKMVRFRMSKLDMLFEQGPMYGITFKEFLAASDGIISTLADYMKVTFEQNVNKEGWYVVTLTAK